MPNVKRRETVTEMICSAMLNLIENGEPYESISVQQLIREAKVCRNSFYRHYKTMDDVFRKGFERICSDDSKGNANDNQVHDFYSIFEHVCRIVKKNKRFFRAYYEVATKDYFSTIIGHVIKTNALEPSEEVPLADYYNYACRTWMGIGIVTDWMLRGFDLSIEELVEVVKHHEL